MSRTQVIYGAWCDIDLDSEGKSVGAVHVSISTDRSAYRALRIPLVVIRNGIGPGCLLTGGSHGDEWEGQIVASGLCRDMQPGDVNGTLIIMPHANLPACEAGSRLSPLDGGNLNMAFSEDPAGGPTRQIARFIAAEIFPRIGYWIDLHSGGGSLTYWPLPAIPMAQDRELNHRALEALSLFGAPRNLVFEVQEVRSASSAAQRSGITYVYGEFGGGGLVSSEGLRTARAGTSRLLSGIGVLRHKERAPAAEAPRYFLIPGSDYRESRRLYWFARRTGCFEPRVSLGDEVDAGALVGMVHPLGTAGEESQPVFTELAGTVICLRNGPRVENGDCLGHLGIATSRAELARRWTA